MTADGIVFFGMLLGATMWAFRKWTRPIRQFSAQSHHTEYDISDEARTALYRAGYVILAGKQTFTMNLASERRQVEQNRYVDGIVERNHEQFALIIDATRGSNGWTNSACRGDWEFIQRLLPELTGIVVFNSETGKLMKLQAE
jgi:hypothetical protein